MDFFNRMFKADSILKCFGSALNNRLEQFDIIDKEGDFIYRDNFTILETEPAVNIRFLSHAEG